MFDLILHVSNTTFSFSSHQLIQLSFSEFFLGGSNNTNCSRHQVLIFDGDFADGAPAVVVCDQQIPCDFVSSSNEIFLYFISDIASEGVGFVATLTALPPDASTSDPTPSSCQPGLVLEYYGASG